jgi:hypothetical protein
MALVQTRPGFMGLEWVSGLAFLPARATAIPNTRK